VSKMTKLPGGGYVETWWDPHSRNHITAHHDEKGYQVGDAHYVGTKMDAKVSHERMVERVLNPPPEINYLPRSLQKPKVVETKPIEFHKQGRVLNIDKANRLLAQRGIKLGESTYHSSTGSSYTLTNKVGQTREVGAKNVGKMISNKTGQGRGNWGHQGRPGERGGSA